VHQEEQEVTRVKLQQDDAIGTLIAGRYEILQKLGSGGMSTVYKARHQAINKIFAVKILHPHLQMDTNAILRFQQEAKAVSKLFHPNIVGLTDFGVTDDGQPFQVMEYLSGKSLADIIKEEGRLSPLRALRIFMQVCDALEHAHGQSIIHRDLKPSNIMLVEQGGEHDFVKLVDFGIAKMIADDDKIQQLTQTGEIFGSPPYMSPEQCMGRKLDVRSDFYSMGCLMYETVAGKPPLIGNNVFETIQKHTDEMPKSIAATLGSEVHGGELERIIFKAMAKDREQRYQTAQELKADLVALSRGAGKGLMALIRDTFDSFRIRTTRGRRQFPIKLVAGLAVTTLIMGACLLVALESIFFVPISPFKQPFWPKFATGKAPIEGENKVQMARQILAAILGSRVSQQKKADYMRSTAIGFSNLGAFKDAAELFDKLRGDLKLITFDSNLDRETFFAAGGDAYYYTDRYQDAAAFYEKAQEAFGDIGVYNRNNIAVKLADCLYHLHNFKEAQPLLERALSDGNLKSFLDSASTNAGEESRSDDAAIVFSELGDILKDHGDWSRSEDNYEQALRYWKQCGLEGRPQLRTVSYLLGLCAIAQEKYPQAQQYISAYIASESKGGGDSTNLAAAYVTLAKVYAAEHKWLDYYQAQMKAHSLSRQSAADANADAKLDELK
jgi:serine/threonine-protein kinase